METNLSLSLSSDRSQKTGEAEGFTYGREPIPKDLHDLLNSYGLHPTVKTLTVDDIFNHWACHGWKQGELMAFLKGRYGFDPAYPVGGLAHDSVRYPIKKSDEPSRKTDKGRPDSSKGPTDHHFELMSAFDFLMQTDPEIDWLWEGILPSDGIGLLVAKPKVGKTTMAINLAVAVTRGQEFLGRATKQKTVVYLALEGSRQQLKVLMSNLGVEDEEILIHFGVAPKNAMNELVPLIKQTGAGLVIVDVFQKMAKTADINDYSKLSNVMDLFVKPSKELSCCILLLHHANKSIREDGDNVLGSTALLGGVDVLVSIKSTKGRRSFSTLPRLGEPIPDTIIDLMADGSLMPMGTKEEVEVAEIKPRIREFILNTGVVNRKAIFEAIGGDVNIINKALQEMVQDTIIKRSGTGKRGDPFLFSCGSTDRQASGEGDELIDLG